MDFKEVNELKNRMEESGALERVPEYNYYLFEQMEDGDIDEIVEYAHKVPALIQTIEEIAKTLKENPNENGVKSVLKLLGL